ncbi:DDE-type integrase/transposase/recombinase, partial [Bradyrhizobium sp. 139]|nr:DDE-type integrase/transposase/recombinase [Bradyrhizobium sp. 139]
DITYVQTDQGWLYLATVMDLYSRKIVGWAMADPLRAELPLAALRMAIAAQRPNAGLIHHSDRGVQGGFKRSSQHHDVGGCDEGCKSAIGAVRTGAIAIARPAVCCRTR